MILNNRAGDKLRKQADIQSQFVNIFLHLYFATIHINHIRKRLEGVERNTNRHNHINKGQIGIKGSINVIHHKVKVFEIEQKAQICHNGNCQQQFAMQRIFTAADIIGAHVVDDYGQKHNRQIARLAPSVKNHTGNQQNCNSLRASK